jgi:hypothetical protein
MLNMCLGRLFYQILNFFILFFEFFYSFETLILKLNLKKNYFKVKNTLKKNFTIIPKNSLNLQRFQTKPL